MAMRTSITSPRLASCGSWTRATMSRGVQAGRLGHFHLGTSGPERTVGELCHSEHALRAVQAHARHQDRAARLRAQMEARHDRPWVAFGKKGDAAHMIARGH